MRSVEAIHPRNDSSLGRARAFRRRPVATALDRATEIRCRAHTPTRVSCVPRPTVASFRPFCHRFAAFFWCGFWSGANFDEGHHLGSISLKLCQVFASSRSGAFFRALRAAGWSRKNSTATVFAAPDHAGNSFVCRSQSEAGVLFHGNSVNMRRKEHFQILFMRKFMRGGAKTLVSTNAVRFLTHPASLRVKQTI